MDLLRAKFENLNTFRFVQVSKQRIWQSLSPEELRIILHATKEAYERESNTEMKGFLDGITDSLAMTESYRSMLEEAQNENNSLLTKVRDLETKNTELDERIFRMTTDLTEKQTQLTNLKINYEKNFTDFSKLQTDYNNCVAKFEELSVNNTTLEDRNNRWRNLVLKMQKTMTESVKFERDLNGTIVDVLSHIFKHLEYIKQANMTDEKRRQTEDILNELNYNLQPTIPVEERLEILKKSTSFITDWYKNIGEHVIKVEEED